MSELSPYERLTRTTRRTLAFYEQYLGLSVAGLNEHRILNVGAGRSNLNEELKAAGIKPKVVVNVDIVYTSEKTAPPNALRADMKRLPVAEGSFDDIFYLWSMIAPSAAGKEKVALQEAFRVCKTGGSIKIYPFAFSDKTAELAKKYPFFDIGTPTINARQLITSNLDQDSVLKNIGQFVFNLEALPIDAAEKLVRLLQGRKVGTLTIKKPENLSEDDFGHIVNELKTAGAIF